MPGSDTRLTHSGHFGFLVHRSGLSRRSFLLVALPRPFLGFGVPFVSLGRAFGPIAASTLVRIRADAFLDVGPFRISFFALALAHFASVWDVNDGSLQSSSHRVCRSEGEEMRRA